MMKTNIMTNNSNFKNNSNISKFIINSKTITTNKIINRKIYTKTLLRNPNKIKN